MRLLHTLITRTSRCPVHVIRYNNLIALLLHPLPMNRVKAAFQQRRVCRTVKRNNYADKRSHVANI